MIHPFENPSTFLWFLARCPRHAGGHDTQQHDKLSAADADGASVVADHTLQQITLLAAVAVGGAVAANALAAAVAVPCVAGFDDFRVLFLDPLTWPQGAAAAAAAAALAPSLS
jgi:hypothetical protein